MSTNLFDQSDEVIEKYIDLAQHRLVNAGHLPFVDEPIEDSPKFDYVCEVAQELYEESTQPKKEQ
jgi:hypothetical protein